MMRDFILHVLPKIFPRVMRHRGHKSFSSVPILVISGVSDRDAPARALAAGATAFFSKPFSPGAVWHKLEALIDAQ
jgi:DNA-binding response OmpR family regulator